MPSASRWVAVVVALVCACAAPATAGAAEHVRPTGRWLVVLEHGHATRSASALSRLLERTGAHRAGRGVPQLGIATVAGPAAAIGALRRDPAVASVSREWYRALRRVPNDRALHVAETEWPDVPPGTPIQWAVGRERFFGAWDVTRGAGARVGLVDTGVDASHPDLAGKIASAEAIGGAGDPRTDGDGHGTHVGGLACAATDNSIGVAGAGFGCRLNVVKLQLFPGGMYRDEDLIAGIRAAAARRPQAINMSFGGGPATPALQEALDYAIARGIVLVAAAANSDTQDQGAPASALQENDSLDLNAGRGLVVTAADFHDRRAGSESAGGGVGSGPQISLAAYGFYDWDSGPPGLVSTFPAAGIGEQLGCSLLLPTCMRRSIDGDNRYAYLEGTSMATPQVAALAALVANLNPYLTLRDKLKLIKVTARRPGGWTNDLGWGIVDAARAIEAARRVDRLAPRSRARAPRSARVRRGRRAVRVRIRWLGRDPAGGARLIPSEVQSYELYARRGKGRWRRVRHRTGRRSAVLRLRPGTYRFYTRALDRAGNREAAPRRADARTVVRRGR